jgi:predicted 3-demethylubiquinone-9 3-methyltransferase (glyoxalase superfamily)
VGTIRPSLCFNDDAEAAINFYLSVFKDAEILSMARHSDGGSAVPGSMLAATFRLREQEFMAINGGPTFTFSAAMSIVVDCTTQKEVDYFWEALAEGGSTNQCGWLTDQFGLCWQVVPTLLGELMQDADQERVGRVGQAMREMTKLDIATLQAAYDRE